MINESTINLFKKHGWRIDRGIHNYIYFIFYYPYVKGVYNTFYFLSKFLYWFKPLNPFLKAAYNRYHSKVLSFSDTKKILTLNKDIRAISDKNKQIIPFKYAYKILFQDPDYIAVMDCPCKKTLNAPDWAKNSCIGTGKGMASFWLDHGKKYNARKITPEEAIELVKKFRSKGYLTQGFFKVATGGSTGVICNCHPDTCVALRSNVFFKKFNSDFSMTAQSGYSIKQDSMKCKKCSDCSEICPVSAIKSDKNSWEYDKRTCLGCGLCMDQCSNEALSLYQDSEKVLPLDIDLVQEKFI